MLFSEKKEKVNILRFIPLVVILALVIAFFVFSNKMEQSNLDRNKAVLDRALTRSITQCYALEGTYPPSLEYLVDNYGLVYDNESYFIDYTYIGSNLRPDFTIIERKKKGN